MLRGGVAFGLARRAPCAEIIRNEWSYEDHALTRTQDGNDSYRVTPAGTVSLDGKTMMAHAHKPENCRAGVCIFCQVRTELQSDSE